jgi:hypothetical protein
LTKHADEAVLKAQLPLEDAGKVVESTVELVCNEALVICGAHVKPIAESAPKVAPVKVRVNAVRGKVGKITNKLYNLEQSGEPEKPLNVDLDLYQMENY